MDMTHMQAKSAWNEVTELISAADFLIKWADCEGPLANLPSSDQAVRVVMAARRHLLTKAKRLRVALIGL